MTQDNDRLIALIDQWLSEDDMSENETPLPRPNRTAADFRNFTGLGAGEITKDEDAKLRAEVPDEDLMILPTGEVYLHQVGYRIRLNDVFGPGGWGLFPFDEEPQVVNRTLWQRWMLIVRGNVIAIAPGETAYNPESRSGFAMSLPTAIESAKSNALMRCCKDIGVAAKNWDRKFTDGWKNQYAVRIYRSDRNTNESKDEWRLLVDGPHFNEVGIHPGSPNKVAWKEQFEAAGGYLQKKGDDRQAQRRPSRQPSGDPYDNQPPFPDDEPATQAPARPAAQKARQTAPAAGGATTAPAGDRITDKQYGYLKGLLKVAGMEPEILFRWLKTEHKIEITSGRELPKVMFEKVKAHLDQAATKGTAPARDPGQEG